MEQIWEGDCLELMKNIPDKSVDMILCDLPYGTTACKWDTIIPFEPLWEQYKRIIRENGAIVLTASQPFTSALVMSNPKMFKYEWIWEKTRCSNPYIAKYQPLKVHESILVFGGGKYNPQKTDGDEYLISNLSGGRIAGEIKTNKKSFSGKKQSGRFPRSVQKISNPSLAVGLHPTQKPVELFEYLIKTYTNEGDLVLDNCAGSGTTGIAARNLKREFILIEKEPDYIEIIKNRLAPREEKQ